jgi:hypothetical protein
VASTCKANLEAAAEGAWLLDASIGPRHRVERRLTEQLHSLSEATRAARQVGVRDPFSSHFSSLADEVSRLGLELVLDKRGRPLRVGSDGRPTRTDAVQALLEQADVAGGRGIYALLTASAHSTAFAVLEPYRHTPEHGIHLGAAAVDVFPVVDASVRATLCAVEGWARYCGRDCAAISGWREQLERYASRWWENNEHLVGLPFIDS